MTVIHWWMDLEIGCNVRSTKATYSISWWIMRIMFYGDNVFWCFPLMSSSCSASIVNFLRSFNSHWWLFLLRLTINTLDHSDEVMDREWQSNTSRRNHYYYLHRTWCTRFNNHSGMHSLFHFTQQDLILTEVLATYETNMITQEKQKNKKQNRLFPWQMIMHVSHLWLRLK